MDFFFMLALGRSGTLSLASLLAQIPHTCVLHEPFTSDRELLSLRYGGFHKVADNYLAQRFSRIQASYSEVPLYGEVNSYLRYEPKWLRQNLGSKLLHLVRDGRTYVRSAYQRDLYTPRDIQAAIVPKDSDPHAAHWENMSRFERICWYWNHTNAFLADHIESCCRLEDISRDYSLFYQHVLRPLGLELSEQTWQKNARRRRNTGLYYGMKQRIRALLGRRGKYSMQTVPHWSMWEQAQTDAFWSICGDTMHRLGYSPTPTVDSPVAQGLS